MTGYLILIYGDENRWDALDEEARAALDAAHRALQEKAGEGVRAAGGTAGVVHRDDAAHRPGR